MTAPMLLVLDYPGRRSEARVSDLCLEEAGYDVRHLMRTPLPRSGSSAEYAADVLATTDVPATDVPATGDPATGDPARPYAVLAYCMAAPLALDVAVRTGCAKVLLFDGEPSTPVAVAAEYRNLLRTIGADSDALPSWWERGLLDERSDRFLQLCREHLADTVRRAMGGEFGAASDDAEAMAEMAEAMAPLLDGFLDWMAYLVAAYRTDDPSWDGAVVNILSRDQPPVPSWPGAAATRSVRTGAPRDDLLADPTTRRLALEALAEPSRAGRGTCDRGAR
ncbi:hypothetical protein [Streptomyces apocyni]|uniref:hypothetical protein n=1 Tax=Streptomyces apocyni TaxID=2654677 RepID=UPI0012EAF2E5|nr:hypothetical protein [Streptomyces apocyni]